MKVTANVTRSGGWWAVEVVEVDGAFTQVGRLEHVPETVRDVVALLAGVRQESIDVEVSVVPDGGAALLDIAADQRRQAGESSREASASAPEVHEG